MITTKKAPSRFLSKLFLQGLRGCTTSFAWSPGGERISCCSDQGSIAVFDRYTGEEIVTFSFPDRQITAIAWSPDGKRLAFASSEITIVDVSTKAICATLPGHAKSIWSLSWCPKDDLLASGSFDRLVRVWNPQTRQLVATLSGHSDEVTSVCWSPDGERLASASMDGSVRVWVSGQTGISRGLVLPGHKGPVWSVAWSPDGDELASAGDDRTVITWQASSGLQTRVLEGHLGAVRSVSYSTTASLLLSAGSDRRLIVWRNTTGEAQAETEIGHGEHSRVWAAFAPASNAFANVHNDHTIRICDYSDAGAAPATEETAFYRNAKVLLVGDTGVGKSGLALVLTGQNWIATESTHARKVWTLAAEENGTGDGVVETRETLLWDLAGQPDYRLIHQLHLQETAVALVVFDSRSPTDPLAGVRHWVRALDQASRLVGSARIPTKKFLVTAREDVGRVGLSEQKLSDIAKSYGFDRFFRTSAKESWGISDLAEAIGSEIPWDTLPKGSSTASFQTIKAFLICEKQSGRVLSAFDDLYRAYFAEHREFSKQVDPLGEFVTCIGLLESRDLIHRLSFGNFVLLQPELLDAYATAIINAVKDEPHAGSILEDVVREGLFRMPNSERVVDRNVEPLLLLATIEELLRHDIALRDTGYLIFPSQMIRENPDIVDSEGKDTAYRFEGPVASVYARLAVRLSNSGVFKRLELWKNVATFRSTAGGLCGIHLNELDDSRAELTIFFDQAASAETKQQFNDYVRVHLQRHATTDRIDIRRVLRCTNHLCRVEITHDQVARRRDFGYQTIRCAACETVMPLESDALATDDNSADVILKIDTEADTRRQQQLLASIMQGKRKARDYNVLLCYDPGARVSVRRFARRLEQKGLLPWFDEWETIPGVGREQQLSRDLATIKTVAVLVDRRSSPPWVDPINEALIQYFVSRGKPLFLIALWDPGAKAGGGYLELPIMPAFLRRREWASFRSNEQKGFDALVEEIRVVGDPSGRWRADKGSVASRLISDLSGIPPGHANAERYQGMIFRALDFVFSPWLQGGRKEQEISEGRKRVDIVFDNQAKDGFFADLKTKFDIHCPYIFIECKNYSADPENPEFDQLAGRFSDKRGQFGLLVCRSIENRKAMTARCKDLIRDNRGYILVLDDADIGALIQFRSAANISNLEAYLADRLRDLLLG